MWSSREEKDAEEHRKRLKNKISQVLKQEGKIGHKLGLTYKDLIHKLEEETELIFAQVTLYRIVIPAIFQLIEDKTIALEVDINQREFVLRYNRSQ